VGLVGSYPTRGESPALSGGSVDGIYRSVAIAIARGNADIIALNLRKSRFVEWGER
jgi:hypothetical protein